MSTTHNKKAKKTEVRGLPSNFDRNVSREEISLSEFPVGSLAQRRPRENTIRIQELVGHDPAGEPLYRTWVVAGDDKYGLPIDSDEEVFVALVKFAEHTDFRERVLECTRYQICQLLGIKPDGRAYQRIGQACHRYNGVTIHNDNVFKDPRTGAYIRDEAFGIIDAFRFSDRLRVEKSATSHDGLPANYIRLSDEFLARLRNGNVKYLDLEFYRALSTPLAKRLFRFLDKNAYRKTEYEIYFAKLVQRLPLSENHPPKEIKRLLRRPLDEFVELGFLSGYRFEKGREGWKLHVAYNAEFRPYRSRSLRKVSDASPAPQQRAEANVALFPALQAADTHEEEQLVRRFHERVHGTAPTRVSRSEAQSARKLRTAQGSFELALYTVDFACDAMRRSNWTSVQHFGSILTNGYPERAKASFEAEERGRAQKQELERRQALEAGYLRWRDQEEERRWSGLDQAERDRHVTAARDELKARAGERGLALWSEEARQRACERRARAALVKDLPTFEDWLAGQDGSQPIQPSGPSSPDHSP